MSSLVSKYFVNYNHIKMVLSPSLFLTTINKHNNKERREV